MARGEATGGRACGPVFSARRIFRAAVILFLSPGDNLFALAWDTAAPSRPVPSDARRGALDRRHCRAALLSLGRRTLGPVPACCAGPASELFHAPDRHVNVDGVEFDATPDPLRTMGGE